MLTPTVAPTNATTCAYCAAHRCAQAHAHAYTAGHGHRAALRTASAHATAAALAAWRAAVPPCAACRVRSAVAAQRAHVRRTLGYAAAVAAYPLA